MLLRVISLLFSKRPVVLVLPYSASTLQSPFCIRPPWNLPHAALPGAHSYGVQGAFPSLIINIRGVVFSNSLVILQSWTVQCHWALLTAAASLSNCFELGMACPQLPHFIHSLFLSKLCFLKMLQLTNFAPLALVNYRVCFVRESNLFAFCFSFSS